MLSPNQINIGAIVSFDLYPSALLGTHVSSAKVLAVVDAITARTWIDTQSIHQQVYPFLPEGTVNRDDGYHYVRLLLPNNETVVIGLPWIKEESFQSKETRSITLTLSDMDQANYDRLVKMISACGWHIHAIDWT